MLPRRLAHEKERQRRVVPERLVERLRETRKRVGHVTCELDLLVLRRVALRDRTRIAALVVALVAEADGERAHGVRRRPRHEADDDARVDAAREQRAERHVGDQAAADGFLDALANEREPVALAFRPQVIELRVPLDANRAVLGHEHVSGRQFLDALEACPARDVLEREVCIDRDRVDLSRHAAAAVRAPSARRRTRAIRRRAASRGAASSRRDRGRAPAARAFDPRAPP